MVFRECAYCDYRTEKQSTLSMHVAMHHGKNKHFCPWCTKGFTVRTQLQHHLKNHHQDTAVPCKHPDCKMTFRLDTTMKMHYVRKHMNHLDLYRRIKNDKVHSKCMTCGSILKRDAMIYHVAMCSVHSPFSRSALKRPDLRSDEIMPYCSDTPENTESDEQPAKPENDEMVNQFFQIREVLDQLSIEHGGELDPAKIPQLLEFDSLLQLQTNKCEDTLIPHCGISDEMIKAMDIICYDDPTPLDWCVPCTSIML
jgi:hypothetical protein